MQTFLTIKSRNTKTGPIPVSTTSAASCPDACPLSGKNGCYAEGGPLGMFWKKVTEKRAGASFADFAEKIAALPAGQLWRHNQAGDLIGDKNQIDATALAQLCDAAKHTRGFTYTHYDCENDTHNRDAVKRANDAGFTVNLSGNNLDHADKLAALKIAPVVVVMPSDATENTTTPQGRKVVVCPATQRDDVNCKSCGLCARQGNRPIVGFPAHGISKKRAERATGQIV